MKISVSLPKSWSDLSQGQLRYLLRTIHRVQRKVESIPFRSREDFATFSHTAVATRCFLKFGGFRVDSYVAGGVYLSTADRKRFFIPTPVIASVLHHLDWISDIPSEPVRIDVVDGADAVAADLSSGFSFDSWLACENFWQIYQLSQEDEPLRMMGELLYRKPGIRMKPFELLGIFYWWASIKTMVAGMFPSFFKSVGGDAAAPEKALPDLRRIMDTQIRALTKGDITKEKEILSMEAMRALTELDAQAREYEELQKKYPSK